MMGPETQGFGETYLYTTQDELENLGLDEPTNGQSVSDQSPDDPLRSPISPVNESQSPKSPFNSYLDPPSYADAVFSSFDSSSNGRESPKSPPNSNPTSSEFFHISVSDPQKEQDMANSLVPGGTAYFTYLITTRTNLPEFGGPGSECTVRRRFKDVVTLADRLSESYRGFFIPIRPDKSVVESQVMQKHEFVEQRRSALEKYLRKLAAHPAIGRSDELRVFLQEKGKLPMARTSDAASRMLDGAVRLPRQLMGEEAVDSSEVLQPAKGGRDLLRLFKELKQAVVNDWSGTKPPVVEEDKEFMEKKERVMEFEHHLSNLSQQAESLVKAQQDIGETMGEFGLAFVKLTKFEVEEAVFESQKVRANDYKNVATAAVKASRLYRELNSKTVQHLDNLHEYLGLMLAINSAFSDRSNALLTVQTLSSDISSLSIRIEKLEVASSKIFGGDRSRNRKVEELKETMKVTEDAKCCAVREYDRIKENNRSEFERFDKEVHNDFLSMLKGLVVNQAGYAEKMAAVWDKVAEETSGYTKITAKE